MRRLVEAGALPGEEAGLGPREIRRVRLLHAWAAAGLSVERIVELVDQGALSLSFLDVPVMATPERLDRSYRRLAGERGVPVAFLQAVHQALGFAPPEPDDRAGEDDLVVLEIAELFRGVGIGDDTTLRLLPCTPTACGGSPRPRRSSTRPTSSAACGPGGWTSAS